MILYNHPSYFKSGEINSCIDYHPSLLRETFKLTYNVDYRNPKLCSYKSDALKAMASVAVRDVPLDFGGGRD